MVRKGCILSCVFFLVSGAFFGAKLLTVLHGRTAGGRSNHMDMHGWYLSFRSSSLYFIFWIATKMEKKLMTECGEWISAGVAT